jgi:hypothetical protein
MAQATAGRTSRLEVRATPGSGSWVTVNGLDTVNPSYGNNQEESTQFGNTGVARILTLQDATLDASGNWQGSDAGQIAVRTAFASQAPIEVRHLFDGTSGFSFVALVTSFNVSSAAGGKVALSCNFATSNGLGLTAV